MCDSRVGMSRGGAVHQRCAAAKILRCRACVQQRIEEQLVRDFGQRPILRPKAKQDDAAFPVWLISNGGGSAEIFSTQDPAAQQRTVVRIVRNGHRIAGNLKRRASFKENRYGGGRSETDGVRCIYRYLKD